MNKHGAVNEHLISALVIKEQHYEDYLAIILIMVIYNVTFNTKLVKRDILFSNKAQGFHLQLKEATAYVRKAKLIKDYGFSQTECQSNL